MVVVLLKTGGHSPPFTVEIDPQLLECSLQVINSWSMLRLLLVHLLNMPRLFHSCQLLPSCKSTWRWRRRFGSNSKRLVLTHPNHSGCKRLRQRTALPIWANTYESANRSAKEPLVVGAVNRQGSRRSRITAFSFFLQAGTTQCELSAQ